MFFFLLFPNPFLPSINREDGGKNPERTQLACLDTGPQWVHAWHRWAKHLHNGSLTNPVGNTILKPERGERPPGEPLRAAEEQIQLIHWTQDQKYEDVGEGMEEQGPLEPEAADVSAEA